MYRKLQIVFVLVLPILATCLDTSHLVRSLHAVANKHRQLRRQLLAGSGTYPYVVVTEELANECHYDGSSCVPGGGIIVTDAAPTPESDLGKLVGSISGKSYICGSHKTAAECTADTANKCEVYQVPVSPINKTMVEVCDMAATELVRVVGNFGLCPKSLADQLFTCTGIKDSLAKGDLDLQSTLASMGTSSSSSCTSRDGIKCELLEGTLCIPTALKSAYDLTSSAGAQKLQSDMQQTNGSFWGCCKGAELLSQEASCQAVTTSSSCTGNCQWQAVDDASLTIDGYCTMSSSVFMNKVATSSNSAFGTYVKTAIDKCKPLTVSACESSPQVTGASLTKAKELAQLQFAAGGGGDCSGKTANSVAQDKPMSLMAVLLATAVMTVLGSFMST